MESHGGRGVKQEWVIKLVFWKDSIDSYDVEKNLGGGKRRISGDSSDAFALI